MNLTEEVKSRAVNMGVDLVGIAPVERFKYAPLENQPKYFMRDAKAVIVFGARILEGICDTHGSYDEEGKTMGPYMWYGYPVINWSFSWIAIQVGKLLEDEGYKALPFPPTGFSYRNPSKGPDFLHKHAAVAAGLGELGLNRLFLSPQFGAHQRLLSIITNAPLDADPMYSGPSLCNRKECRDTCVKLCPMHAFEDKLFSVKIGERVFEYSVFNQPACMWHVIGGKYLRGTEGLPRYPDAEQIEEIYKAAGGRAKVQEMMNPLDKAFFQFTHVPTCGVCQVKCRAPWR